MNAKPKTELNRCLFVQKRNSVNGALDCFNEYIVVMGVVRSVFQISHPIFFSSQYKIYTITHYLL